MLKFLPYQALAPAAARAHAAAPCPRAPVYPGKLLTNNFNSGFSASFFELLLSRFSPGVPVEQVLKSFFVLRLYCKLNEAEIRA